MVFRTYGNEDSQGSNVMSRQPRRGSTKYLSVLSRGADDAFVFGDDYHVVVGTGVRIPCQSWVRSRKDSRVWALLRNTAVRNRSELCCDSVQQELLSRVSGKASYLRRFRSRGRTEGPACISHVQGQ